MLHDIRRAALMGILGVVSAALGAIAIQGCGDGNDCVGGIVRDGKCEGKCEDSKCLANNTCIDNRCQLKCTDASECNTDQACTPAKNDAGADVNVCQASTKAARSTDIGIACPYGDECNGSYTCPDGTVCGDGVANATCSGAECKPLHCLSVGIGDGNAYCTQFDCTSDTDCSTGMYCGVTRLDQKICGTNKGTDDPCLDPADFNTDGATFSEGPLGLLRKVCRVRTGCVACTTTEDCSGVPGQDCVQFGSESVCAKSCGTAKDCEDDNACTGGYCLPKFGSCKGTGQFCEPCVSDLDCAAAGPTFACLGTTGDQVACLDVSFPITCTDSTVCPVSPSGKKGMCMDDSVASPGSSLYDHCYFPYTPATNKFKCW